VGGEDLEKRERVDWLAMRCTAMTSGRTGSLRSQATWVSFLAPAMMPARKLHAMSTGAKALGLVGRCGNACVSSGKTLRRCRKLQKPAWPAWPLSFWSVVEIWMVLAPALKENSGVTVW
jgi:hypothetical protein